MAKILIIDDDENVGEILARLLGKDGHEVHATLTGEDGIRAATKVPFDLIIADIFLPAKSGLEVIQELTSRQPGLKVIAMTAFGAQDDIDMRSFSQRYGAAGFIEKPFDHQKVRQTVREAIG